MNPFIINWHTTIKTLQLSSPVGAQSTPPRKNSLCPGTSPSHPRSPEKIFPVDQRVLSPGSATVPPQGRRPRSTAIAKPAAASCSRLCCRRVQSCHYPSHSDWPLTRKKAPHLRHTRTPHLARLQGTESVWELPPPPPPRPSPRCLSADAGSLLPASPGSGPGRAERSAEDADPSASPGQARCPLRGHRLAFGTGPADVPASARRHR